MDLKVRLLLFIIFVYFIYNICQSFFSYEGFSTSQPADDADYDISVDQDAAVSLEADSDLSTAIAALSATATTATAATCTLDPTLDTTEDQCNTYTEVGTCIAPCIWNPNAGTADTSNCTLDTTSEQCSTFTDRGSCEDISGCTYTAEVPATEPTAITPTFVSFTQTAGSGSQGDATDADGAVAAWATTGLTLENDGSITGTTSSDADIDGYFELSFAYDPVIPKYIKIKIISGNTDNIGLLVEDPGTDAVVYSEADPAQCSNGAGIQNNPCAPEEATRDNERMAELLGSCIGEDGTAIPFSLPPSFQREVNQATAARDAAQEEYNDAIFFDGDEKEALDAANLRLTMAQRSMERGRPMTKSSCTDHGGTWEPSPDLNDVTKGAVNACTAIQLRKAEIQGHLEEARIEANQNPSTLGFIGDAWKNTHGLGDILDHVVSTAGGNAKAKQVLANVMNVDISSISVQDHSSECNNSTSVTNLNQLDVVSDTLACLPVIEALGGPIAASALNFDIGIDISDISQTITKKNTTKCTLDANQTGSNTQTSNIDDTAFQDATNNLTGGGEINHSADSCTSITNTQQSCEYIKSSQCCNNNIKEKSSNLLSFGGECPAIKAHNITQLIDSTSDSSCNMNAVQAETDNIDGDITNNTEERGGIEISPNYFMYAAIIIIVLAVIGGGIYLFTSRQKMMKEMVAAAPPPRPPAYNPTWSGA